jgi:hypothetical protein
VDAHEQCAGEQESGQGKRALQQQADHERSLEAGGPGKRSRVCEPLEVFLEYEAEWRKKGERPRSERPRSSARSAEHGEAQSDQGRRRDQRGQQREVVVVRVPAGLKAMGPIVCVGHRQPIAGGVGCKRACGH